MDLVYPMTEKFLLSQHQYFSNALIGKNLIRFQLLSYQHHRNRD